MSEPHDLEGPDDAELGRLLRDTFASREHLADPDRARRLATKAQPLPSPRRWPTYLAAAAAVVLVAGVGTAVATRGGGTAPSADRSDRSPSSAPSGGTEPAPVPSGSLAQNKAAAAAAAAHFIDQVPLPAGTRRLASQPAGYPDSYGVPGPSDQALTHTSWWSVPADAETVRSYLYSHQPDEMSGARSDGTSGDGSATIFTVDYRQTDGTDPAAYLPVTLQVAFTEVGGRTLVRADTFTAARYPRPAQAELE